MASYYVYTMSNNNNLAGSGTINGTLVTVVDIGGGNSPAGDGHLTDAGNLTGTGNNANEQFTVTGGPGGTGTFFGGILTGNTDAGDFRADIGGTKYWFSHNATLTGGTSVTALTGFSNTGTTDITLTCFLPGTMIRTPKGETAVEKLEIGQLVTTADGRSLPVKWIGRQTVALLFADPLKTAPICIKAGALDENVPSRDLYTSAGHAMVLDGNLVIAAALVNGRSVVRADISEARIVYHHVELEEHAVIFANDAATETYCDNVPREVFDNAAEYKALYPNAQPIIQLDMPTVKSQRQMPVAIKRRLAERADAIAGGVSKVA